jgi:hypothetical protein
MTTLVEWVVGVLRAGEHTVHHGDPFTFSATLIRRGDTVEVVGASGEMYPGLLTDLRKTLKVVGVTKLTWDRKKAAGDRHIETTTT